jgi:DNA polymerase
MPKGDDEGLTHGVDIRGLLIPRPGHAFIIFDYGQIEARVIQWLAGNTALLEKAAKENIYQAMAKILGWYPETGTDLKREDPAGYLLSKSSTLGLGFKMGAAKFIARCEKDGAKLEPCPREQWVLDRRTKFTLRNSAHLNWDNPDHEAQISTFMASDKIVQQWRSANAPVVAFWNTLETIMRTSAERKDPVHYFTLPSGRKKPYWSPHISIRPKIVYDADTGVPKNSLDQRITASLVQGGTPGVLHGGILAENIVQSVARDVMFHGAMSIVAETPRWRYLFNIYDEVVAEIPLEDVDQALVRIPHLLCHGHLLSWAKGLPLEVEGGMAMKYTKGDKSWKKFS